MHEKPLCIMSRTACPDRVSVQTFLTELPRCKTGVEKQRDVSIVLVCLAPPDRIQARRRSREKGDDSVYKPTLIRRGCR